ncbi:MAG: carbohydrate binding family 9 domain-containing protein [Muricauda sp.]|jgi:hypothetical protein|nr:DUF5916 domain-containing protein [Allomuricauda sp.]MBO6534234.1 carbohydrate binding family 9 domain-containing protein [Allomuricauda sp.]MBO6590425.1 carbohydrate binding family 9 domain-containing protein [Allomuricauda sp.]MBO6620118.1 carbohydrate binding family 9 domain-containing protein [Allomuricauda sp.]MBO6645946.1 carbohydrate binding family 9 domain-containing protein [Allomuricauda sp.]MBO6748456.1 carbohydrate binding family 9 domain-containing protein [Allomuricauda sp.]
MLKKSFVLVTILCSYVLFSQSDPKSFTVKYIDDIIKVDGIMDESVWEIAESASDFHQYFPSDTTLAFQQTDIKMLYNNTTLYVGIKLNTEGDNYVIPSLQRDYRAGGNDNISLMFDTFNDGTNAFLFGMNPYGVRREALISNGGSGPSGFTTSWDVKWKGETKIYEGYYICELAIPLTSFKFRQGETKWRFNSYRFDMQSNETSSWMKIPQNQLVYSLAFMGDMIFEKPLGKSRTPMALIPYINGILAKDYENNEEFNNFNVGGDAKISIGNGMNLDVTLNPDFSNVQVDNVIVNLSRFQVALPERRQFFIDNNDLFGSFGNERDANPFFSRRIGIAKNKDDETIENGIVGGVRLSGKLNENWRLGLLNIQTEEDEENEIASNNNTVLALQKKMFSRSNLSFIFVNRQSFGEYDFLEETDRYNRVVGLDYNLASADNTWTGKFFYHKSFARDIGNRDASGGMDLRYNSRFFNFGLRGNFVGNDFRSDLGFVRRQDIVAARPFVEFNFWPQKGKLNSHGFRISPNAIWRPTLDYKNTDYNIFLSWQARFKSQEEFSVRMFNRYTFLTEEFDPTGTDGAVGLPGDIGYYYTSYEMQFQSDRRRVFSYSVQPGYGDFYNGNRFVMEGDLSLRLQPKMLLSLGVNYNSIMLPEPYASRDIWLVSPRIELTFNKSVFWSTLIQYSNQADNLGINSRLQWRFAPLSDLFLVYNDNYFVNTFMPRTRSINLKLTYWLNI